MSGVNRMPSALPSFSVAKECKHVTVYAFPAVTVLLANSFALWLNGKVSKSPTDFNDLGNL
jgi:hypothetical protein